MKPNKVEFKKLHWDGVMPLNNNIKWDAVHNKINTLIEEYDYEMNIHALTFLNGSKDIKELKERVGKIFDKGWGHSFELLKVLNIMKMDEEKYYDYDLEKTMKISFEGVDDVMKFIDKTSLENVFLENVELKAYMFGLYVGEGSNGKKNRSSQFLFWLISKALKANGIEFKCDTTKAVLNFEINEKKYFVKYNVAKQSGTANWENKISTTKKAWEKNKDDFDEFIWIVDGPAISVLENELDEIWDDIIVLNTKQFEEQLNGGDN